MVPMTDSPDLNLNQMLWVCCFIQPKNTSFILKENINVFVTHITEESSKGQNGYSVVFSLVINLKMRLTDSCSCITVS